VANPLPPLDNSNRLIELECHERFRRNLNRAAFSQNLCKRTGSSSRGSAKSGAFPLPGDCTDDGAEGSPSADILACSLVGADAVTSFLPEIRCVDGVKLP